MMLMLCVCMFPAAVTAAGNAHFYVQAADVMENGILEVTVYLTDATNMGGVEAELSYDTSKVSFINARLGTSLDTQLADIYHDQERAVIKYVALYKEAQEPHGALMKVTFQLKEGDAYQPTLQVLGVVDNSDEVVSIPFDITYQHADGTWQETVDDSGVKAEEDVLQQALTEYGSKEDLQEAEEKYTNLEKSSSEIEDIDPDKTADTEKKQSVSEDQKKDEDNDQALTVKEKEEQKNFSIVLFTAVILAVGLGMVIVFLMKRKKKK